MTDPSLTVGAVVHAKVTPRILCQSEAHRIYAARADLAFVQGMVENVSIKSKNGRNYRYLCCVWSIRGRKKRVELPLGQAKLGPDMSRPDGIPDRELEVSHPISQATSQEDVKRQIEVTEIQQESTAVTSPSNSNASLPTSVTVHEQFWIAQDCSFSLNGSTQRMPSNLRSATGAVIQEGGAPHFMSPIDYFMSLFPMRHLGLMVAWTNTCLRNATLQTTSCGEIWKFFGLLINMTRFKFSSRKELWNIQSSYKYIPAANFGRIMSYRRFDELRRYLCFTPHSRQDPKSCSSRQRWALCEAFLFAINEHRQERFCPSELLCVDESMSRWYGQGGEWISVGLPHYVAIDRKPEAGCEIQDIACGRRGVILGMSFVRSSADTNVAPAMSNKKLGTRVLTDLCAPWMGSGRIVCADSFFASVEAAALLFENDLRFIGVVKNSIKKYPMSYLSNLEMDGRGSHVSMTSRFLTAGNIEYTMGAVVWVDRNRRYFISTCGTTLPGTTQERMRMRDFDDGSGAARVRVGVEIPSLVETYYSTASIIDRHNRCRQDDLDIEKTVEVREWSFRVNSTLLSVCVVDGWLVFNAGRAGRASMRPYDFYATLAEELIDNSYDEIGLRDRNSRDDSAPSSQILQPTSGAFEHLTPTKRRRTTPDGRVTTFRMQRRCGVCSRKTTFVCSSCEASSEKRSYFCHSGTDRECYAKHLHDKHGR